MEGYFDPSLINKRDQRIKGKLRLVKREYYVCYCVTHQKSVTGSAGDLGLESFEAKCPWSCLSLCVFRAKSSVFAVGRTTGRTVGRTLGETPILSSPFHFWKVQGC